MKVPSSWKKWVSREPRLSALRIGAICGLGFGLAWAMMPTGLVAASGGDTDAGILIDFEESEGYVEGDGLEDMEGWWTSEEGGAVVTGEEYRFGAQSLRIVANEVPVRVEYWAGNAPRQGVRFIQASVRALPVEEENTAIFLNFWGAGMEFNRGSDQMVYLHLGNEILGNGAGGFSFPVSWDTEEQTGLWLNMVIRQDLEAATWDLFLDGELVAVDLPLGGFGELIEIEAGPRQVVYLDGIGIGPENPLFVDSDGDGMPDAYEVAHRLNPYVNDRNGDKDGDGISNIAEYQAGTPPDVAGSAFGQQVIYVDNSVGRDSNSGKRSISGGNDGPKFSIKAAMEAAQNGAIIVVLPGMGVYNEGSRSAKGKRITIRTVEPIVIK